MTMPHLMNCGHMDDGWCLDCVKRAHEEHHRELARAVREGIELAGVERQLLPIVAKLHPVRPRPMAPAAYEVVQAMVDMREMAVIHDAALAAQRKEGE